MKKIIFIILACSAIQALKAQSLKDAEVPSATKAAFSKKYPETKAKWEREGENYEAEFKLNGKEASSVFNKEGNFVEFEQEIEKKALPSPILPYCEKNFTGYSMSEISSITLASGSIRYEVELHKGKERVELLFDDKGSFLKKSNAAD